jgi:hypothetical protein
LLASTLLRLFASAGHPGRQPRIPVQGPIILAFSPRVEEADLKRDPDLNESISDFRLYTDEIREPLAKAGIEFREVHRRSFCIEMRTGAVNVDRLRQDLGYYFIQPGKKPHVEYGVQTSVDIAQEAKTYFGITVK